MYTPLIETAHRIKEVPLGSKHTAVLFDNIKSSGRTQYAFLVVVFENGIQAPILFVAAEVNQLAAKFGGGSHFLGVFDDGGHGNLGDSDDWADPKKFFPEAVRVATHRLGISPEKKPLASPDSLVKKLTPRYVETTALVKKIDGPYVDLFEAGLFVGTIATVKILTEFKKVDSSDFADQFNGKWIEFLQSSYLVNGSAPDRSSIVSRYQSVFPEYRELVHRVFSTKGDEKVQDAAVQLMWALFSHCTGKTKPENDGAFVTLVVSSGALLEIIRNTLEDVHE